MNNPKLNQILIKWSPFKDEDFMLVSNNVLFYRIFNYDRSPKSRNENFYISDNCCAELIGSITNYQNQKLVSWYPGVDAGYYTIALHEMNNSQIKVFSLFNQSDNQSNTATLDIEHERKSNFLEWNPITCNYLALAFEKQSELNTLCIWDAYRSNKPIYKLDEFESCHSLCWHPQNPNILFTSTNSEHMYLFDLRSGIKPVESVSTPYINEFSIDPKNSDHAASYENNNLVLWDLRKFQDLRKPVALIEEPKPIKTFKFCPSKPGRVAVLLEAANSVNIYRLEERDNLIYKDTVNYLKYSKNTGIVNSFSWHSKESSKLMICSSSTFNSFLDLNVPDFCPLEISHVDKLLVGHLNQIRTYDIIRDEGDEMDIGEKMRQRALKSYGVGDFKKNIDLLNENDVKYLWYWFDLCNRIHEKPIANIEKYSGVKSVVLNPLFASDPNLKSYVLKVCGWSDPNELITRLEEQHKFERAACISIFNNLVDRAIDILKNASKSSQLNEYLALSIALSCMHKLNYSDSKELNKIMDKLTNPYLKALFSYKIDPQTFDNLIYNDPNLLLPDRICMAMSILSIEHFVTFISKELTPDLVKQGNLYGILLTGLNSDICLELFQSYLHLTGDVQTPAVAIIHSRFTRVLSNKYANGWIESYRDLLNCWMMWEQRAEFDIKREKELKPKIFVRCGHCGESLSSKKKTRMLDVPGANMAMTCQACRKPSLKCSVCSLHMTIDPPKSAFIGNKDKMTYWFLFCKKCTHGGHLGHLESWFKTNPECPVMKCNCQCFLT